MAKKTDLEKQLGSNIQRGQMAKHLPPEMRDAEDREAIEKNQLKEPLKSDGESSALKSVKAESNQSAFDNTQSVPGKNISFSKKTNERKIPFMTYLDNESHKRFERLYLDIKSDARSATGKALSQSEMVEVLILYVGNKTDGDNAELNAIAENIINSRPNK